MPGEVYEVDIEIWATCVVLPPWFRLALSILGRDFDHGMEPADLDGTLMGGSGPFRHDHEADRPARIFDNAVTIYAGGDRPSALLVPIIEA